MITTTFDALMAAVRTTPDDDLPRLVLADWYEENGEGERAEFVRVQIALARKDFSRCSRGHEWRKVNKSSYPEPVSVCDTCGIDGPFWPDIQPDIDLRKREKKLAEYFGYLWFPGVHRHLREAPDLAEWPLGIIRRGFLEVVRGPLVSLMVPGVLRGREVMPINVEVTDREPHPNADDQLTHCGWIRADGEGRPDELPHEIYDLLEGGSERQDAVQWLAYPKRESAISALSTAILRWARSTAA